MPLVPLIQITHNKLPGPNSRIALFTAKLRSFKATDEEKGKPGGIVGNPKHGGLIQTSNEKICRERWHDPNGGGRETESARESEGGARGSGIGGSNEPST